MRSISYFTLFITALFVVHTELLSAQTFNYKTREASELLHASSIKSHGFPDTITVWQDSWSVIAASPTTWGNNIKFKSLNSFVKFAVDQAYAKKVYGSYSYIMTYELHGFSNMNDTTIHSTINDTLSISYNSDSLTAYQDIDVQKFSNYHKIRIILTGLYDAIFTPVNLTTLHNLNFFVEGSITEQRYDKAVYGNSYQVATSTLNTPSSSNTDYLEVGWTPPSSITPVNYELEWTYVDDYSVNSSTGSISSASTSSLAYDFNHNSTRVWLDTNYYRIPVIYNSGYLAYRVRMVRPDSVLFQYPIYSDWSVTSSTGIISSLGSNNSYHITNSHLNDSLNWQYTISFAEGGKYKHVLSYYDGLLKNRQSITRFNSNLSQLLATENIYDYEGRPAIKTLPTPINSTNFRLQQNVSVNSLTNLPYKARDFDTVRTTGYDTEYVPLKFATNALASYYYSSQNIDTTGCQKFVPDAEGYPFVQTIYSTGFDKRIDKQGGAGDSLQIGNHHETRYDYVGGDQAELDRLFGLDIGYAQFYKKTITCDPNGQMYKTISDYEGRQVASELLPVPPDSNCAFLPDVVPVVYCFQNLYKRQFLPNPFNFTLTGNNYPPLGDPIYYTGLPHSSMDKDSCVFNHSLFMDVPGFDEIEYQISLRKPLLCTINGQPKYLSVRFHYEYDITDNNGAYKFIDSGRLDSTYIGSVNSSPVIANNGFPDTVYLGIGQYNIHTKLTYERHEMENVIDSFVKGTDNCLLTLPYFIRKSVIKHHYPCPTPPDECTQKKYDLMAELWPNAKYGQFSSTFNNNAYDTLSNTYSHIIGSNNSILTYYSGHAGNIYRYQDSCLVHLPDTVMKNGHIYTNIRLLPVDTFVYIFNDSIAESLLPLHPEYCKLRNCFPDTFKVRLSSLPNGQIAAEQNLLYLDSIINQDPIVSKLSSILGYASPKDSLATFKGGHIRIDSLALILAYCGCSDSVMFKQCFNTIFHSSIMSDTLINDYVREKYFTNVISTYLQNRERFKDYIYGCAGDSCGPCVMKRMTLIAPPVIPNMYNCAGNLDTTSASSYWNLFGSTTGGTNSSTSTFWSIANNSTPSFDTSLLNAQQQAYYDSAVVITHHNDSLLCQGSRDSILTRLGNCNNFDTVALAGVRTYLRHLFDSGLVHNGAYTPKQVRDALVSNGISLDDLCNPYIISFNNSYPTPGGNTTNSDQHCFNVDYYNDVRLFLNEANVIYAFTHLGTQNNVTISTTSPFESIVYGKLNSTSVLVKATYTTSDKLYTLFVYNGSTGSDTVKLFFRSNNPDTTSLCNHIFQSTSIPATYSFSAINCIRDYPGSIGTGYISQFTFVATISRTDTQVLNCATLGWTNTIEMSSNNASPIAQCIPCTQMRALYQEFMDTLSVYNIKGANHPYYAIMLKNFMNGRLQKMFTIDQYQQFIESCALADSMKIPLYGSYAITTFNTDANADAFLSNMQSTNPTIYADPLLRYRLSGKTYLYLETGGIPLTKLYKLRTYINSYSGPIVDRYVNQNDSDVLSMASTGLILIDTSYNFSTISSTLSGINYFDSVGLASIPVGINPTTYHGFYVYRTQAPGGTSATPDMISLAGYKLWRYISDSALPAYYFPGNLHTINSDYFLPEKTALLNYTYQYQNLQPIFVLDSLNENYLNTRVTLYQSEPVTYSNPYATGAAVNLFVSTPTTSWTINRLNLLSAILDTVSWTHPNGSIFYGVDSQMIATDPITQLIAYRCSDGSYWYRYFAYKDTMYNTFVRMPGYIPENERQNYVVNQIIPLPSNDTVTRFFKLKLINSQTGAIVYANGMTDYVLTNSMTLHDVVLGHPITGSIPMPDTFNNCERSIVRLAEIQGTIDYYNYLDSAKGAMVASADSFILYRLFEMLYFGYRHEDMTQIGGAGMVNGSSYPYGPTIYYYDRAGNLTRTVPPDGIFGLSDTLLPNVDVDRVANAMDSVYDYPAHLMSSFYNYNSLNQVTKQETPDGGKTVFYYDNQGRLIFSQNDKQKKDGYYTYNLYDKQGRITETGQSKLGCPFFEDMVIDKTNLDCFFVYPKPDSLAAFMGIFISPIPPYVKYLQEYTHDTIIQIVHSKDREDVVYTVYDTVAAQLATIPGMSDQENLRKRVSAVKFFESLSPLDTFYQTYSYATYYSYDAAGNVKTLTHDFPSLATFSQRYKRVDYDYDLISGKVNLLSYNRSFADQYYQRYSYDDDNRITKVETSNDGFLWSRDAAYSYYKHGPLARISLGDLRVQGIDFAYTIQGWLKAINADTLMPLYDIGRDANNTNNINAVDAVAGTIDYFKGDYKPIGASSFTTLAEPLDKHLYNGNIARQSTAFIPFSVMFKKYYYDRLNRLGAAKYNMVKHPIEILTSVPDYESHYKYDPNGNITQLKRYGNTGATTATIMDSLYYKYDTLPLRNNMLRDVYDSAANSYTNDIRQFSSTNPWRYQYDEIGNVTSDMVNNQYSVRWNLYNKVTHTQNLADSSSMLFRYDGAGNRIAKYYSKTNTNGYSDNNDYYVRDAQGNILAVYNEKKTYKVKKPVIWVSYINDHFSGALGSSFVTTVTSSNYAGNGNFHHSVMSVTASNQDFAEATIQQKSASFYALNDPSTLYNMLNGSEDYINPMATAESGEGSAIIAPALDSAFAHKDKAICGEFLDALFLHGTDSTEIAYILSRLCQVGDSMLPALATYIGTPVDSNGVCDTTITYLQSHLPNNADELYGAFASVNAAYPKEFNSFLKLLIVDTVIYQYPLFSRNHGNGTIFQPIMQLLSNYGNRALIGDFFDNWSNDEGTVLGFTLMRQTNTDENLLTTLYNYDPYTYIDGVVNIFGRAAIDTAIASMDGLDPQSYLNDIYNTMPAARLTPYNLQVITNNDIFSLAEHHLYGSSCLGIKKYWQDMICSKWDYTYTPTRIDTIRFSKRQPWYSAEYQDNIKADTTTLYGNADTQPQDVKNYLGLKQYEVTDHLGDVMATISDKRSAVVRPSDSVILTYKPALPSVYDYYPFGMLMPGRYVADTTQHCATVTHTILAHIWIDTWVTPFVIKTYGVMQRLGDPGIDTTANTITVSAKSHATGDGISFPVDVDTSITSPQNFMLAVQGLTGGAEFIARVVADDTTVLGYTIINTANKNYTITIPGGGIKSVNLNLSVTNYNGAGGAVVLSGHWYHHQVDSVMVVTELICDKVDDKYRFGFNGKEKDNEWAGIGNHMDYGDRNYDSRVAHWFSRDNKEAKYPMLSPYIFSGDNPILYKDYNGQDFGVKINNETKTIVFVSNIYTINNTAYEQAVKAAGNWNAKTATVDGYKVSFQVNVQNVTSTDQEIISAHPKKLYDNDGNIKPKELSDYKDRLNRAKATQLDYNDDIGNLYAGNKGIDSKSVSTNSNGSFTAGVTADGHSISMNSHNEMGDMGAFSDLVTHEIGHTFGLDDEGKGGHFSSDGIMKYSGTSLNSISDADVMNVVNYASDALHGNTNDNTNAKVKVIENVGTSDGSNPICVPNK